MNGVCRPVGVDVAGGGQRGDDAPPQVGVDDQAGQPVLGGVGVEQRGQHGDMAKREHRRAQRVDVGQLVVRARLGGAGQLQQSVGEQRPALCARPVRIGVGAQRGLRLQQQPLCDTDLGFGAARR